MGWHRCTESHALMVDRTDKLNKENHCCSADLNMKKCVTDLEAAVFVVPADFERFIADETEKLGKVARFANIKAAAIGATSGRISP